MKTFLLFSRASDIVVPKSPGLRAFLAEILGPRLDDFRLRFSQPEARWNRFSGVLTLSGESDSRLLDHLWQGAHEAGHALSPRFFWEVPGPARAALLFAPVCLAFAAGVLGFSASAVWLGLVPAFVVLRHAAAECWASLFAGRALIRHLDGLEIPRSSGLRRLVRRMTRAAAAFNLLRGLGLALSLGCVPGLAWAAGSGALFRGCS